jgi:hypothetical protein
VTSERDVMQFVAGSPDSMLGGYVEYARQITDAPLAFHVGGGLAMMAGAIGSNIYWRGGGHREQWPNLFLLLLAPSGIFRKSTSVDLPTNLLAAACSGSILDREFSPEQFIRNLAEQPTSLLKESEFSSLLERMKSSYMQGMKQRLTDLYDCQDSYDRVIRGANGTGERIRIVRPSLSILAASTLDWLVESLTETDMRSGFMPRFLFIAPSEKEPEPPGGYWATGDSRVSAAIIRGLSGLSRMRRAQVSFKPAHRRIVEWTEAHAVHADTGDAPEELLGLYSRLGHHLAKLCTLLTVSEDAIAESYEVQTETADRAITFMQWILEGTARVFDERVTFSKFEQQAQKALRFVGAATERGVLLKKMKCSAQELDRLVTTLKERGEIVEETEQTGGRPKRMLVRTLPDLQGEERGRNGEVTALGSVPTHAVSRAGRVAL